jgi:serine/threonine protein kinase
MAQLPRVGDRFGRYRIDSQIGFGGMGVVFAATDLTIDRRVALKVVSAALGGSAEFVRRFEREAAVLARLNSPHVIGIFDFGEHDGCPYIATQYVAGGDLGGLIQARGPMPPALAASVCAQVADALVDAHQAGVVHRDVKPSNVLLRDATAVEPHAYLCDFGIARTVDQSGITVGGSVSGTWTYLAPECGSGQPATPASDIYSVGCLLWSTLTGRPPYRGTDVEVAIAHQRAPLPQLAGTDPFSRHVNEILRRTLAKDPAERYPDADVLRTDLLATAATPSAGFRPLPVAAAGAENPATPTPSGGRLSFGSLPSATPLPPAKRSRAGWIVAAACVGVLAVTGGAVALAGIGQGDDDDPSAGPTSSSPDPSDPTDTGAPVDPEPTTGIAGDIDADGLGDLVVEQTRNDKRNVLTWTSTGESFAGPEVTPSDVPRKVAENFLIADLDGDDLSEQVRISYRYRTDGPIGVTATLADGSDFAASIPTPTDTALITLVPGDADGDGTTDLVITTWDEHVPFRYYVALGTGDGFAAPELWLETTSTIEKSSTEVGDLDGDGRVDVAVVTTDERPDYQYRSTAEVYLSTGTSFRPDRKPRQFDSGLGPEVLAGDVDGDGDAELVAVDIYNGDDVVPILVLDYAGGLGRAKVRGLVSDYGAGVTMSDVDGDGRSDLVQLYRTEAEAPSTQVEVALATDDGFAAPADWGRWKSGTPRQSWPYPVGSFFP